VNQLHPDQIVAVILAGGFGTRVQHLLPDIPKPMAPMAGRPCIEWLIRYLLKQGVRRTIISTGYRAEVIERHFEQHPVSGASVVCAAEPRPMGTAGGFIYAVRSSGLSAPGWLVMNGDTLVFADLKSALSAMQDAKVSGAIYGYEAPDASRYGTLVTDASGDLVRFEEKKPGRGIISTGLYVFRDALLNQFPQGEPLSLEREVFPALTSAGVSLKVLRMTAPFLDIGTPESLPQAEAFVQANLDWFELAPV
jgi:D-glycero-alpha-D-manno-heptose 1-phosphate guanylyltransferase